MFDLEANGVKSGNMAV